MWKLLLCITADTWSAWQSAAMLLVSTGTFDSATNRVSHYLAVSTIGQERERAVSL